jgi:hypothetical protein
MIPREFSDLMLSSSACFRVDGNGDYSARKSFVSHTSGKRHRSIADGRGKRESFIRGTGVSIYFLQAIPLSFELEMHEERLMMGFDRKPGYIYGQRFIDMV